MTRVRESVVISSICVNRHQNQTSIKSAVLVLEQKQHVGTTTNHLINRDQPIRTNTKFTYLSIEITEIIRDNVPLRHFVKYI